MKPQAHPVAIVLSCLIAAVAALTVAVLVDPGPLPGELSVVRRLQRLDEPVPWLASAVRLVTGTEACLVASVPAAAWLWRHGPRHTLAAVLVALVWTLGIQPVGKELVDRPRPSEEVVEVRADHSSKSYPSGHSLSTTTTWGAASGYAWRTGRRRTAAVPALILALTGLSSSVQGVHWPSDAVAGTIVGAVGAVWIVRLLLPHDPHDDRRRRERQR